MKSNSNFPIRILSRSVNCLFPFCSAFFLLGLRKLKYLCHTLCDTWTWDGVRAVSRSGVLIAAFLRVRLRPTCALAWSFSLVCGLYCVCSACSWIGNTSSDLPLTLHLNYSGQLIPWNIIAVLSDLLYKIKLLVHFGWNPYALAINIHFKSTKIFIWRG